jgi:cyclophilin family peptidyl-prolyl cis-trans isomerase
MPDEKPSRKRSNPLQPKKSPFSSRGVQIGVVLLVVVIAVIGVWAFYPKSSSSSETKGNPIAVINTTMGTIRVELFQDKMPVTVGNFVRLANAHFYDGMIFHRTMDNFMIQAGNTYPNGTTKESPYGSITYETSDVKHVDGAISMASTGDRVGGSSQFFICDGAQSGLDGRYAAFGVTIQGLDVVKAIAALPNDGSSGSVGGGRPTPDVIIHSITIEYA